MNIYKVYYTYEETAFMLVESDGPDDAVSRLMKQFSDQGVKASINSVSLLQEMSENKGTIQ